MNTNTQPKIFEWTNEFVKEIIQDIQKDGGKGITDYDFYIQHFIKEKQQPIEERIEVLTFEKDFNYSFGSSRYVLNISSKNIPEEKKEAVKLAIEGVLNNDIGVFITQDEIEDYEHRIDYWKENNQNNRDLLKKAWSELRVLKKTLNIELNNPTPQPQDTKEDNPKEVANNLLQQGIITLAETVLVLNKENWEDASKKLKEILDAKKAPKEEQSPVLFVTHDGVNVYGGEHLYSVDNKTWGILSDDCNNAWEAILWNKGDDKIFSTKEAAEQYILANKPLLSLGDCCIGIPSEKFDMLEQIAKEKLANTKIK